MFVMPKAKEARALEFDLAAIAQKILDSDDRGLSALRTALRERVEVAAQWQQDQIDTLLSDLESTLVNLSRRFRTNVDGNEDVLDNLQRLQGGLSRVAGVDTLEEAKRILRDEAANLQKVMARQLQRQEDLRQELEDLAVTLESKLASAEAASRTDYLTRLGNRAAFEFYLDAILEKVRRGHGPYTLALLDLDGFKLINDRFGHLVGDAVLASFAARLRDVVGERGFLARLGGDEFAAVLPWDERAAELRMSRLQYGLERRPTRVPAQGSQVEVHTGVSYGLARLMPEDGVSEALQRADGDLYRQKRTRRAA